MLHKYLFRIFSLLLVCTFLQTVSFSQTVLFTENFNDCELPEDWTVNVIGEDAIPFWEIVDTPSNENADGSTMDGSCMFIIDDDAAGYNTPGYTLEIISPTFDGTQYSTLDFSIDIHYRHSEGQSFSVLVFDGTQYRELVLYDDWNESTGEQFSEYVTYKTDLSFFANEQMSIKIKFDDGGEFAWWAGFDNISVLGSGEGTNVVTEHFNDCQLPEGWFATIESGEAPWQFGFIENGAAWESNSMNGSCFAYFDDDILGAGAPASTVLLISPAFDGTEYAKFYLDFQVILRTYAELEGLVIYVYDGTDAALVEYIVDDIGGPQFNNYENLHIDLSAFRSETMHVVFAYTDGGEYGWWVGIDNVKVSGEGIGNDICSNAIDLVAGEECLSSDNETAVFTGEPLSCGEEQVGALWYHYYAENNTIVKVNTGADFNDIIEVFTGNCDDPNGLQCTNADEFGFTGETLYMDVQAGTDYYFKVSGLVGNFGQPRGNLCMALEEVNAYPEQPSNDDCVDAHVLTIASSCVGGNNLNANFNGPEPTLNLNSRADIWYQFEMTTNSEIEILSHADFADVMTLYSGNCNNLTEIACNDLGQILNPTDLEMNQTYYLQISAFFATLEGNVCVEIKEITSDVVENDICIDAVFVEVDGNCVNANNFSANFDGPLPSCSYNPMADIWFEFIAPSSENVKINTGADFAHTLSVYSGDCNDLEEVYCNPNPTTCDGYFVVNGLTQGEHYWVQIASSDITSGFVEGELCLHILNGNSEEGFMGLELSVSVNCISEGNGELVILVNGGIGNYTFFGTPNGSLLQSGEEYLVIVSDENGCEKSLIGTADCGALACALAANAEITNATCYGAADGQITVLIENGVEPFDLQWSEGGATIVQSDLSAGTYALTINDANACVMITSFTITEPDILIADATAIGESNENANDGTATTSVSGGTDPYTYLWSNDATSESIENLSPGIYTVEITDANGCSVTESVVVASFDCLVVAEISATNISCSGASDGIATVSLENGNEPYTYLWSNDGTESSITDLDFGTYTVTVTDDNACPITANVTITEPDPLFAEIENETNVTCFGSDNGEATVSVLGGTNPFVYEWSNGGNQATETGLIAGDYIVTITDANDCETTTTLTIDEPTALDVSIIAHSNITCTGENNGSATVFSVGGTLPFSYQWNDPNNTNNETAINLAPATYMVTVTDGNNCEVIQTVEIIEENPILELGVTAVSPTTESLEIGSIEISPEGGLAPYTFEWTLDGNFISDEEDIFNLGVGEYDLLLVDAVGCTITQSFVIDFASGLENLEEDQFIFLQPNPTQGEFTLQIDLPNAASVEVYIYDVRGKLILQKEKMTIQNKQYSFDLSAFAEGVYPVKIFIDDEVITRRVVLIKS